MLLLLIWCWWIVPLCMAVVPWCYWRRRRFTQQLAQELHIPVDKLKICAFMHPYCQAGGGGERVLWLAINAIHEQFPNVVCFVYTGDHHISSEAVLAKVTKIFNISFNKPVYFVPLRSRSCVEAKYYPVFTLLGQSLGSVVMGVEALARLVPHIYVDSMGYPFTLGIFRYLSGAKVAAYVHYPTISTDMISEVLEGNRAFNNRAIFVRSKWLRYGKLLYYRIFAWLYGLAGQAAHLVMCNSSWTLGHIVMLWAGHEDSHVHCVYPPCNVDTHDTSEYNKDETRKPWIVSVAQFRPEKNHELQLRVFSAFMERQLAVNPIAPHQLFLIGGVRDASDEARVCHLQQIASELGISDRVHFLVNASFEELTKHMRCATVGLHTMSNEHFGIGIVEFMTAGLIPLAHNSGGPRMDIVTHGQTGFLASSLQEYVHILQHIFQMTSEQVDQMRQQAREKAKLFSDEKFKTTFSNLMQPLVEVRAL